MQDDLIERREELLAIKRIIVAKNARIAALEAKVKEAVEALALLVTGEENDPCWLDHHGNCQAHMVNNPCEMAIARATLAKLQENSHDA